MIGAYDFCGHYDWTFAWLLRNGGQEALRRYWEEAIAIDSQRHAAEVIRANGFQGMMRYWGHTLSEEAAGYTAALQNRPGGGRFLRMDMYECPSKGFLIQNGLEFSPDYCDHCMGWIGPMLASAGFTADHEHDHKGHCWWEMRAKDDATLPSALGEQTDDVRLRSDWDAAHVDRYRCSEKCTSTGATASVERAD